MSEPFLSEIRIMAFDFPPKGWALCNGQTLPINQNQPLFALLGTTYGGDGRVNFQLPNLQGQVPIHVGGGHTLGERAGSTAVTLNIQQLPMHLHTLSGATQNGGLIIPTGNLLAGSPNQFYIQPDQNLQAMSQSSVSSVGGSQAHNNMMPYLVLNFCIALQGIFPSRN
ncbi:MAG: tail fiber protein [Acidobacteriota bacterium]|nr:tail fiber protein [Acidobacteriota bacterium]